jgi:TonB family protein
MSAAKVLALTAPRPEYPYEARRQRATGSGVATLTIDSATGNVTDVRMSRSTGSAVLDNATISAFRRWRFRPGTVTTVQTPITYTLTGAAY